MFTAVVGLGDASDGWLLLDAGVFGEAVAPARFGVPAVSIRLAHQRLLSYTQNALSRGGHAAGNTPSSSGALCHRKTLNAAIGNAAVQRISLVSCICSHKTASIN